MSIYFKHKLNQHLHCNIISSMYRLQIRCVESTLQCCMFLHAVELHLLTRWFNSSMLLDPVQVLGDARIDPRASRVSTSDAPAGQALETVDTAVYADELATRVTLAGIFSSLRVAGTEHVA